MKRPHKYHAKPVIIDGVHFASQKERRRWEQLKLLERAGQITELRRQSRFPIHIGDQLITTYVADATYREGGKLIVEDAKGVLTDVFKIKSKLMAAVLGIEIRIV